jgi:type I restriction enzyme, S subunit
LKTIEKAATKNRAKAKHADSPPNNPVRPELVEGFVPLSTVVALNPRKFTLPIADDDLVSFVPMKCVEEETGNLDATTLRPWHEVKKGYTAFQDNDVIFAKITPCMENGKFAIARGLKGGRAAGSTEFHVLRPSERLSPNYLMHFLFQHHIRQDARMNMRGAAGQLRVPTDFFESLKIALPPLPTQHRIVAEIEEKLSRLDAAQSALLRAQANLKRYRASVLQKACDQALLSAQMENFGKYMVHIESGKSFKCEERPPKDHEIGVAKVSAVTWGEYDKQQTKTCKDESRIEERYLIKSGDFLFTRANTIELIGACVIAKHVALYIMLSDKILRFHFAGSLDKRWALLWLKSHFGRKEIERLSTGNQESMRNIGQERIRQIQIAVPSLETQSEIISDVERRLSVIDRTEQTLRTQLERAKRLRQSILQRAFSPTSQDA